MKDALIIQNVSREGPGLIAEALRQKGFSHDLVNLERGDPLPDPDHYRILIVLGGPDSANDETPKIRAELAMIRDWIDRDKPYLGVCLGLQLMVKAAGGRVVKACEKELGFLRGGKPYEVVLTEAGKGDPFFKGVEGGFPVFQLHGETVEPAPGMELIGRGGGWCPNQILRYKRRVYGIQCHIEVTRELLDVWTLEDTDLKTLPRGEMLDRFSSIEPGYRSAGLRMLSNFLGLA